MITLLRVKSPLAPLALISFLIAPVPAAAARANHTPAPVVASNEIIPLPLVPTLPAAQRLCSAQAPSGLGYTMLRPASGPSPAEADYVLVNYIGYLAATGAVFDQGMQAAFPVNGVIPGFSKGLQMMVKTGIARFCIPAAMGYGAETTGAIPANSDLVFQVELVDYKTAAEIEALRKANADQADQPDQSTAPSDKAAPPQ